MIQSNENFYRKIKTPNSTTKSININQYNKTINYKISNTNINNNITNLIYPITPIDKFNKKFLRDSEGTSNNSSDIKFEFTPTSLKEQILSPEDEDLYLNYKIKKFSTNDNNIYDDNYLLNYNLNPQKLKKSNNNAKKILILDLDETLVHSSFYPFNCEDENNIKPDIFFTIFFNNKYYDVYVLLRPYFHEFLNKMSKIYDIYIFTASIKEYAEPLLIKLDKNNLIKKKLFRDNCTLSEDNKFIKDLNNLNENLKNVILIDNNPNSFRYNKCNGIPIKTWHYEQNDRELIKIIPFLTFLSTVDDVREYIPKIIDNDEIDYNRINNILSKCDLNENDNNNNIKKYEKKLINIIKKNSNNIKNKNKNKNYSHSKIRINYPHLFTNNISIKNKNIENNFDDKEEEKNIFANSINFNRYEERKNNNYTLNDTKNHFHSPATINFREPSSIRDYYHNRIKSNNTILNKTNLNVNRVKKIEKNRYIRSKSSYNLNDISDNINNNNFSTINFNMINNQVNNKNRSHTNNKIHQIKNYKSFNNDKTFSNNNFLNRQNDEKSSLFIDNNEYYLFTLNQNDNYKNYNINIFMNKRENNMMNNNNKSLEQKMSLSNRLTKFKNNNNKTTKNNENKKQQKENLFRYKNIGNKNNIENNKNEENEHKMIYNHVNVPSLENKKIQNFKPTKQRIKKSFTGRNNENGTVRNRNMDKMISVSKTNELINNVNNLNSINHIPVDLKQQSKSNYIYSLNKSNVNTSNNENSIPKKIICSTLNNHYMNNHQKKLKPKVEENKNNTMEITTNIKSRFFNNDNYAYNLKGISRKKKISDNKKSNINYNIIKQKGNNIKKNISREINLLNKFMKEFNNNSQKKNIKGKNEQNEQRKYNTQRESRYIMNQKHFNYNYDSIYQEKQRNKNEIYNKEKNDKCENEIICSNYYKKSVDYKVNKDNNNYLRKKVKTFNYGKNQINFNDNEKVEEIENYNNIKNIKYSSLLKLGDKKRFQKNSENQDKRRIIINDKNNYLMNLYYSYGNNKE